MKVKHKKHKMVQANLKTSLYFAGSITFATFAVGAAVSIPVYLHIQKQLNQSIKAVASLSSYLTQLSQKLGLPTDQEFSQKLAHGYEAVYTPGSGTQIFKEVNGEKVMIINVESSGTVSTAAQFSGVEALNMMDAISSAKSAYGSETNAMDAIMSEYGSVVDDSSYKIEEASSGIDVYTLILRDELAKESNLPDAVSAHNAYDKYEPMSQRDNNLFPHHDLNDFIAKMPEAKALLDKVKTIAKLDMAVAGGNATMEQQDELAKTQQAQNELVVKAQDKIDTVKVQTVQAVAHASQKVSMFVQEVAMSTAKNDPSSTFLRQNTSTIQKWLPILGATFGNIAADPSQTGLNAIAKRDSSKILRQSIYSQLQKNGITDNNFLVLKNEMMKIIGLEKYHENWLDIPENVLATKKIISATQLLSTFAKTNENERLIILNIQVRDIANSKNETHIMIAHPVVHANVNITYDFDEFEISSEDTDLFKADGDSAQNFTDFSSLVSQLSLFGAQETNIASFNTKSLDILHDIMEIIKDNKKSAVEKWNKIKPTKNKTAYEKLNEFVNKYYSISALHQEVANIIFDKTFKSSKNFDFKNDELNAGISYINNASQAHDNPAYINEFKNIINNSSEPVIKIIDTVNVFKENLEQIKAMDIVKEINESGDNSLFYDPKYKDVYAKLIAIKTPIKKYFDDFLPLVKSAADLNNVDDLAKVSESFLNVEKWNIDVDMINDLRSSMADPSLYLNFRYVQELFDKDQAIFNLYKNEILRAVQINEEHIDTKYLDQIKNLDEMTDDKATKELFKQFLANSDSVDALNQIISLYNDTAWTPIDVSGKTLAAEEAINVFLKTEANHKIITDNFKAGFTDVTAIKESIRYAIKGVDISSPVTQDRISAAKDVAKDLDSIASLAPSDKTSIQNSIEQVITSQDTQTLAAEEFKEIMKYTQTVFVLFPDSTHATAQLNKVLNPASLGLEDSNGTGLWKHPIIRNIKTLNEWVDQIKIQNPGKTITLQMIKDYAWSQGITVGDYANGNPDVDAVKGQNTLMIVGAQLIPADDLNAAEAKTMLVSHYSWGLWSLDHSGTKTNISPVPLNDTAGANAILARPSDNWASSGSYNSGYMYSVPLEASLTNGIREYDVKTGEEQIINIPSMTASDETRTAIAITINGNRMVYGVSTNTYIDEFKISGIAGTNNQTAVQTRNDYSKITEISGWTPAWAATAIKVKNDQYLTIPLEKDKEYGLGIWKIKTDGHLEFVNLAKFSSDICAAIDGSKSGKVWATTMAPGETSGNQSSVFMLTVGGKLINIWLQAPDANGKFAIDDIQTDIVIDATKASSASSSWRGMTYNQITKEINLFGSNTAVYVPDQSKNIKEIYNQLLT